jgi:hypothetical protein
MLHKKATMWLKGAFEAIVGMRRFTCSGLFQTVNLFGQFLIGFAFTWNTGSKEDAEVQGKRKKEETEQINTQTIPPSEVGRHPHIHAQKRSLTQKV